MYDNPRSIGRLALALALSALFLLSGGCGTTGASARANLKVKVLAVNDFHGQISGGKTAGSGKFNQAGSAPVLAAYLRNAQAGMEGRSLIVSVGDLVGASPAVSALLQDEPTVMFFNTLANGFCSRTMDPRCNLVAAPGNHEFDEGVAELQRMIHGGNHAKGPFLENPYPGARYPYVAANIRTGADGGNLLPPYVVKTVDGVPMAFIGIVTREVPSLVSPPSVAGLSFTDEATAVNRLIPELRAANVHAIVVVMHQGGSQPPYSGRTDLSRPLEKTAGDMKPVTDIVSRLDGEVDVVLTAHSHQFTNALVKNAAGRDVLVTQAYSSGTAFADIDLEIDPGTRDIVAKSATIATAWALTPDGKPAVTPDPQASRLLASAEQKVGPTVNRVVNRSSRAVTRSQNRSGESDLGNLVADSLRAGTGADFAFINPGGLRADLPAGDVTWGNLFGVLPFGNQVVTMKLTGEQVCRLLAQQWHNPDSPRMLQVSGLSYTWKDMGEEQAGEIVEVKKDGLAIDRSRTYSVATVSFLATGGDGFTVLRDGAGQVNGPVDIDALAAYVEKLGSPLAAPAKGRIKRIAM